jgi:hypothetical protein
MNGDIGPVHSQWRVRRVRAHPPAGRGTSATAAEPIADSDDGRVHQVRLRRLAAVYVPAFCAGAWLSLRHGVGARPGGDPGRDLPLRGTAFAPPLYLPVALLGAAALSPRRGAVGTSATAVAGLVGLAFTAGTTLNLGNDIVATRAVGAPVNLTVGIAVFHWAFGPTLTFVSFLALRHRRRARASR